MLLRSTLLDILKDQRPPTVTDREVDRELTHAVSLRSKYALLLTGVRRAGKSVLQAQLMRERKDAFYCNLEDTRLYGLSPEDFPTLLSLVDELVPRPSFSTRCRKFPNGSGSSARYSTATVLYA